MIKTKFFQTCIGVSIVLLSLGFFFHSIQSATASPSPDKFFQSGTNKIGKYSISLVTSAETSGQTVMATILNTENGVSATYSYRGYKIPWEKEPQQLPTASF